MSSWHSYPKVYNIGHPGVGNLFDGDVIIQEKVDGSQFSFGLIDGELKVRSKGKEFPIDAPEKMFNAACQTVLDLGDSLTPGWTYRCEYFQKPKHNTLAYDRIPSRHLILFDIETAECKFLGPDDLVTEAERLRLEYVPFFLVPGDRVNPDGLRELLEKESVLGGQKLEGIVVKNYSQFTRDGKVMMGKHVSEKFRELNHKDFKLRNPAQKDIVALLGQKYRTEARFHKAVQHLKESGHLLGEPKDIGSLIKECQQDIQDECREEIQAHLWKWAWPKIARQITAGLPEWYKDQLLEQQFNGEEVAV